MYPNAYGRGLNVSRETTLNFGLFGARTETNKDIERLDQLKTKIEFCHKQCTEVSWVLHVTVIHEIQETVTYEMYYFIIS